MEDTRKTRNWSAIESSETLAGGGQKLVVSDEVETLKTSEAPELSEAQPQGINPRILILDLAITTGGIGGDVVEWVPVTFTKSIAPRQYDEVTVRGAISDPVSIKVVPVLS